MEIDIYRINSFGKRKKVNTIKFRTIHKVIEEDYFKESQNFPDNFMKQCINNENEAQFITHEVKK